MSDVLRTLSSAYRSALGRFGLLGSWRRSPDDRPPASAPRGRLFRKYVLLIVGLVSLVLLLNSALDFWFSYDENKAALFRIQQEKAGSAARRIEQFIDEIERQLGWTTAPQWAASPLDQRRFDYVRLLRQVPAITELIQLDDAGKEQLKVSRLAMDVVGSEKDYSGSPGFIEARQHRVWFSPVYFRKESEPYMTVSLARAGRNAGVTVAEVNLKLIWDVITGLKIGQGGYAYVVDRDGRLIAHPDISLVLRNTDLATLPQVAAAHAEAPSLPSPASGGGSGWGRPTDQAVMVAKGIDGKPVLTAHAAIAPLGWTVFVELPLSEALASLYGSMLRTAGLLALALVLATLAALLLARRMTVPIRELQAGAARIGAGELDRHIDIQTGDELEDLAGDFNRMAADLQKSYADLEKKVEDRTAELKEALDRQTATAEVLGVINSSPGDLTPVFDAMLQNALRLCEADFGVLLVREGNLFRTAALRGVSAALAEFLSGTPREPGRHTAVGRMLDGEDFVHFEDMAAERAYHSGDRRQRAFVELGGTRSYVAVALRKDGQLLGSLAAYRREVRPFTDKQIALLQNFAAQAVIAMENARLLTETREALEQQTATAEVLQVINGSPGDLTPVFEAIVEKAHTLCGAACGSLQLWDGEKFRGVAMRGFSEPMAEVLRQGYIPGPNHPCRRVLEGERIAHYADLAEIDDQGTREGGVKLGAIGTILFVALRKDDVLLGQIVAARHEVRPFSEKEIALVENFAAQAVIAMENARLITETREALEQQTATAEVLGVINSSPGDLAPVFDAILEKARSLCGAAQGALVTYDGEHFRAVATHGQTEAFAVRLRQPFRPAPGGPQQRLLSGERLVHVPDVTVFADADPVGRAAVEGGIRTLLMVPLRKDHVLLGYIAANRLEVEPFSDKQVALLENFAAQAVIAMENARLITETREALEQQTATAEVLQVINSSPGDLVPVFDAMLDRALGLCGAAFGVLWTYDGERVHASALRGVPPAFAEFLTRAPHPVGRGNAHGRLLAGEPVVHIADVADDEAYRSGDPVRRTLVEVGGGRSLLAVPLRKDDMFLGDFVIYRQEVRPFSNKQIALLQNFAAQAVIAMENARLITETREALEQQTATAEVLQVINSSPGDLAPVFDAMLEKAVRLCEASFGGLTRIDGDRFHAVAMYNLPAAFAEAMRQRQPRPIVPGHAHYRLSNGEDVVQVEDVTAGDIYRSGDPSRHALADLGGARTVLWAALRKDNVLLGAFVIYRKVVQPFTDKQIALLQNFAAQAVIAIENARLITETREALEQQTATAEVLGVINSSPGELAPVFGAMLEKATRLCDAAFGILITVDGEELRAAAMRNMPQRLAESLKTLTRLDQVPVVASVVRERRVLHIHDFAASDAYRHDVGISVAAVQEGGVRSVLYVPLVKDNRALGVFVIFRQEVRPFSEKQIALLQNFAAQAVIAMENARLITETREALEQQTATSEILQVINSSPGELTPVFEAILDKAHSLCGIAFSCLQLYAGGKFRAVAAHSLSGPLTELLREPAEPPPGALARLLGGERFIQVADMPDWARQHPEAARAQAAVEYGLRTVLFIPLRKDAGLLGYIAAFRQEVRPFSGKEIALLQNFAAQAVIAMENARLLTELRQRTRDLEESLEYQTATSDVLKVISQSTFDLQPVLDTVLATAARLCNADIAGLARRDGEVYRVAASYALPPDYDAFVRSQPFLPGRGTVTGRTALEGRVIHIADIAADPDYAMPESASVGKIRTTLGVPLLRGHEPIGVIWLARQRVEAFSERQIELVSSFADQAVIAIENARLFNELRARTEELGSSVAELKMLSEVGQAVSSTLDVRAVLSTILNASLGVTWANAGAIFRYSRAERAFRLVEAVGWDEPLLRSVRDLRVAEAETAMGEAAARRMPMQLAELAERPSAPLRDASLAAGFHSALIVPLVGAERILGAIILMRQEAGEFPAETVRLMQTLASQSVLAIQNARLFREIADKSEQLALASQHKSQFLANMSHELRTPLNAILGYAELLVDGIYGVLPDRPKGVLERIQNNGKHLLALINDVLDLAKIEAGQLTLTLEDYSVPEVVKAVVTATEPLATSKGLKLTAALQDNLPMAHGDARRVSQVLLNLVGNAIKFTDKGEVEIRAHLERSQFVLTVRDTGPGIADADQERIFGEFQQIDNTNTRKKGGTGLGLAISKRMVELQGGTISVDSVLGQGSTFRVVLPVHVDEMMEEAA